MMPKRLVLPCLLALSACATQGASTATTGGGMRAVELRNSTVTGAGARYDVASGRCSSGLQLLTHEQFEAMRTDWKKPEGAKVCSDAQKAQTPPTAGYPARFAALKASGSAHVLVRLQADGSVESAHAVCATDSAFAQAAEETARTIVYTPRTCDGQPARGAFLLPFSYDWK